MISKVPEVTIKIQFDSSWQVDKQVIDQIWDKVLMQVGDQIFNHNNNWNIESIIEEVLK